MKRYDTDCHKRPPHYSSHPSLSGGSGTGGTAFFQGDRQRSRSRSFNVADVFGGGNRGVQDYYTDWPELEDYYMDADKTNKRLENLVDDDLDPDIEINEGVRLFDIVSKRFRPTPYNMVNAAIKAPNMDLDCILWRACKEWEVKGMMNKGCARPGDTTLSTSSPSLSKTPNTGIGRPNSDDCKQQVRGGRRLPEFTSDPRTAVSFSGYGGHIVIVRINSRYLSPGSASEQGFVTYDEAPLTVLAQVDRRLGFLESDWAKVRTKSNWNAS